MEIRGAKRRKEGREELKTEKGIDRNNKRGWKDTLRN